MRTRNSVAVPATRTSMPARLQASSRARPRRRASCTPPPAACSVPSDAARVTVSRCAAIVRAVVRRSRRGRGARARRDGRRLTSACRVDADAARRVVRRADCAARPPSPAPRAACARATMQPRCDIVLLEREANEQQRRRALARGSSDSRAENAGDASIAAARSPRATSSCASCNSASPDARRQRILDDDAPVVALRVGARAPQASRASTAPRRRPACPASVAATMESTSTRPAAPLPLTTSCRARANTESALVGRGGGVACAAAARARRPREPTAQRIVRTLHVDRVMPRARRRDVTPHSASTRVDNELFVGRESRRLERRRPRRAAAASASSIARARPRRPPRARTSMTNSPHERPGIRDPVSFNKLNRSPLSRDGLRAALARRLRPPDARASATVSAMTIGDARSALGCCSTAGSIASAAVASRRATASRKSPIVSPGRTPTTADTAASLIGPPPVKLASLSSSILQLRELGARRFLQQRDRALGDRRLADRARRSRRSTSECARRSAA